MNKFIPAFLAGKATKAALKLTGKRATHFPGKVARRIDPTFLRRIGKPAHVICITGTNGKTTCANMIEDCLKQDGKTFLDNSYGSNTLSGICTTFMDGVTMGNKPKYDCYVLEIDERSSPLIYKYIKPDYLICTNLFRDSVMRNAHTEFIFDVIDKAVPPETRLVLNADDLISSRLGKGRNAHRTFFGVEPLPGEQPEDNIINDGRCCPECGALMEFSFRRYHHIGRARCPKCGLETPAPDCDVTAVDFAAGTLTMRLRGEMQAFPIVNENLFNIYNEAAVIAFLFDYGYAPERIAGFLKNIRITGTRLRSRQAGSTEIVSQMLKGLNPIAASRAFHMAHDMPGTKSLFLMFDDVFDEKDESENVCWYYESDFEALADDSIRHIYVGGPRAKDVKLRLIQAGYPEDRIVTARYEADLAGMVEKEDVDRFLIFYEMYRDELCREKVEPVVARTFAGEEAQA